MDEMNEQTFNQEARKTIAIAVSQIRNSLRGNKIVERHNVEYGFWRNLIGGCVTAVVGCSVLIGFDVYNHDNSKLILAVILGIYSIPICLNKVIILKYGNYYSRILYEQFLSI